MSEPVSLIDRQQERDARALMRLIHDGEIDKFATEITARWERNERLRTITHAETGAVGTAGILSFADLRSLLSSYEAQGADNAALREALAKALDALQRLHTDVEALMADSAGVYGLHQNGDPSPWEDLREGGQFEEWIGTPLWAARNAWHDGQAALTQPPAMEKTDV